MGLLFQSKNPKLTSTLAQMPASIGEAWRTIKGKNIGDVPMAQAYLQAVPAEEYQERVRTEARSSGRLKQQARARRPGATPYPRRAGILFT